MIGAGGTQREVFGFGLLSSLSDPTVGYPSWDFSLLSTVAVFGLHVNDDGTFAADSDMAVWNSSALTTLVGTAHSHGTKVVVSIVLQDFAANTPHMCAGLVHGATTIAETLSGIKAKGIDGVNVDYEGLNGSCGTADASWARHAFTNFVANMRSALPSGSYLSVDTYASSAIDGLSFFDPAGLAGSADALFVMAYDLEYSNYRYAPSSCSRFCLGPTAPVGGYYYNDATIVNWYKATVPASKVILGVPYYGRKACVASPALNPYPIGDVTADTYLDASQEYTSNLVKPGSYTMHRDTRDPQGQERWDTWVNTSLNCVRELYWDDTLSLGLKYSLVNSTGLRGVGLWNLNYGGGAPELWALLNDNFACPVTVTVAASQTTTAFTAGLSAGSCSVTSYDVQEFDTTLNQGWFNVRATNAGATIQGFAGHSYQVRARAHSTAGYVGAWTTASTTIATSATRSHPFNSLYTLDAFGGVNEDDSPFVSPSTTWGSWNIARSGHTRSGTGDSGAVLDGYGGLHPYGASFSLKTTAYWPGWDIARDFAFMPDGSGGFVLDGWGGLHPFSVNGSTAPLAAQGNAYWQGRDIARKVVIFADGKGGYTLDAWGGIHPFGINGPSPIAATAIKQTGYWPNWNIARDIVLVPGDGGHSGYTLDGWGGTHPFHVNGDGSVMPANLSTAYWSGWDIARGIFLMPGSGSAGYTLDGWGGLHPFGGAPAISSQSYWPGRDIAKCVWGA